MASKEEEQWRIQEESRMRLERIIGPRWKRSEKAARLMKKLKKPRPRGKK